jgi:hypothetical protein
LQVAQRCALEQTVIAQKRRVQLERPVGVQQCDQDGAFADLLDATAAEHGGQGGDGTAPGGQVVVQSIKRLHRQVIGQPGITHCGSIWHIVAAAKADRPSRLRWALGTDAAAMLGLALAMVALARDPTHAQPAKGCVSASILAFTSGVSFSTTAIAPRLL